MLLTRQIAIYLSNHGVGRFVEGGTGGDVFINSLPAQPNEAMAIFATGGPPIDPRNEYGNRAIQVLIRTGSNDPRPGETKAQSVIDLLKGFNDGYLAAGGNYIVDVTAQQDGPNNIGQDENGRYEFSQNFIVELVKQSDVAPPQPEPEPPPGEDTGTVPPDEPVNRDSLYTPLNVTAAKIGTNEFRIRWELPGATPSDLSQFYVFINDVLMVAMGPNDREFITMMDDTRSHRIYIAAIVNEPYKEFYSAPITI